MTIVVTNDTKPIINILFGTFNGTWELLKENVYQFNNRNYKLSNIPEDLIESKYFKSQIHSGKVKLNIYTTTLPNY